MSTTEDWISVEDRLPTTKDGEVLVWGCYGFGMDAVRKAGGFFADSFPTEVTHWMPLPVPPNAASEPAAPVDARDALGALANINDLACFASEEDTSTQAAALLQIGHIARAALTRQLTALFALAQQAPTPAAVSDAAVLAAQDERWLEAYDKVDRFLRNNLDDTDYSEYSDALELVATPQASAKPAEVAAGIELAAKWIDKRREDYDAEHGSTDYETGTREYPGRGAGEEYVQELWEIAEGIRALASTPSTAAEKAP